MTVYFTSHRVVESCMPLLSRAFRGRLALPDFNEFCCRLLSIFEKCRDNSDGEVSSGMWGRGVILGGIVIQLYH